MTNEEITKLLKEHEERKASGKPFTDEEYAEADAEDKAKMDDYAEFCAYLAERENASAHGFRIDVAAHDLLKWLYHFFT